MYLATYQGVLICRDVEMHMVIACRSGQYSNGKSTNDQSTNDHYTNGLITIFITGCYFHTILIFICPDFQYSVLFDPALKSGRFPKSRLFT